MLNASGFPTAGWRGPTKQVHATLAWESARLGQAVDEVLEIRSMKTESGGVPPHKSSKRAFSLFIRVDYDDFELLLFPFLCSLDVISKCATEDKSRELVLARE